MANKLGKIPLVLANIGSRMLLICYHQSQKRMIEYIAEEPISSKKGLFNIAQYVITVVETRIMLPAT